MAVALSVLFLPGQKIIDVGDLLKLSLVLSAVRQKNFDFLYRFRPFKLV